MNRIVLAIALLPLSLSACAATTSAPPAPAAPQSAPPVKCCTVTLPPEALNAIVVAVQGSTQLSAAAASAIVGEIRKQVMPQLPQAGAAK